MEKMAGLMAQLRENTPNAIGGWKIVSMSDYLVSRQTDFCTGKSSEIALPKSNVLSYQLENGASVIVRPSGTEPKIKVYVSAFGKTQDKAKELSQSLQKAAAVVLGVE